MIAIQYVDSYRQYYDEMIGELLPKEGVIKARVEEMAQVIALRAKTESIEVESDALVKLSEIGERATLRYAVQLLTPADIIARTNGRSTIKSADVEEGDGLFYDAKSSAKLLAENADKYIH